MLLRYKDDSISFIEAGSNEGVTICGWENFVRKRCYEFYDKIVYRSLNYKRNYTNQTNLEIFLRKIHGKQYALNPLRLLQKHSTYDSIEDVAGKNGYFCSELVAAIFKFLGFLPREIRSAHYLPGSFSAECKLDLRNGAALGDEHLLEFE